MINLKKESLIFLVIFVISSIAFHYTAWISYPIEHFKALFSHSMPYHPLLYVFIIYLLLAILRGIILLIKKIIGKK